MKKILIILLVLLIISCGAYYYLTNHTDIKLDNVVTAISSDIISIPIQEDRVEDVLITAVGDCTIGTDQGFTGYSFHKVFEQKNKDYSYFFSGVSEILANDDISIANMEGTFTDSNEKVVKTYNFKGPKEYANIFTEGNVDIVNLANNHSYDFGEVGYNDTMDALKEVNLPFYGYDNYYIYEIKGLKIGFAGLTANIKDEEEDVINETKKILDYFKTLDLNLIIMTYHWGLEGHSKYESKQTNIGHFAIDNGADLVIGHHPHILQGIEEYNGKYIVYSLANFVFGGNNNPKDKDTMLFQEKFSFKNGELTDSKIKIIPASLSTSSAINDFRPKLLSGTEKTRVLNKILARSPGFKYEEGF